MSEEVNFVITIAPMIIWILFSIELSTSSKDKKENRRGKLIVLMSAGMVSTIFITFSLIQGI